MNRRTAASLVLLLAFRAAGAHAAAWQPSPGHTQLPLWPGKVPDAVPVPGPETVANVEAAKYIAGRTYAYVSNVSTPTMTVYSPKKMNTGAAVVVFPGGGYNVLAIEHEGSEACDWLASRGITAVLLKYRVPCAVVGPHRDCPTALQDAQRAMSLVRSHAAEWHIDPHKIGVLGFSAGGHMVASISTHDERIYPPVDAADRENWRPDFAVALYPGHLATREERTLNSDIRVTAHTPPTFLVQAQDDPVDPVENSIVYYSALQQAGVPAELHVFEKGRHGFGLRRTKLPVTRWPELMEAWLHAIGVLADDGARAQGSD
jgi:acetyl esterase/lipase